MPAFRVREHFDVVENIASGVFTRCVDLSSDSLPLQKLEKALGYGIVVAVSSATHTADYIVGLQKALPVPREVVGRGHCWFSTVKPCAPPIARLRTQPLHLHQTPDSISTAFLSQLTQVIVDFAVAVYTSASQPSVFDQTKQMLIFFCSGRLRLGQPGVVAAGVHLEGLARRRTG